MKILSFYLIFYPANVIYYDVKKKKSEHSVQVQVAEYKAGVSAKDDISETSLV